MTIEQAPQVVCYLVSCPSCEASSFVDANMSGTFNTYHDAQDLADTHEHLHHGGFAAQGDGAMIVAELDNGEVTAAL